MSERQILSCDIGGTNTSIALVRINNGAYTIGEVYRYHSQEISSLTEALDDVIPRLPHPPEALVCSGAGHAIDQFVYMSNVPWNIDGQGIADHCNLPCLAINDFSALAYSLPIIQNDPSVVVTMKEGFQNTPKKNPTYLVIGAGTGLGICALIRFNDRFIAIPSEGGHADVLPMDDQTVALFEYWRKRLNAPPGAELFVSGPGLYNIAEYFIECVSWESPDMLSRIRAADRTDRPAMIAQHKDSDPQCKNIWGTFIRLFARFSANACMFFGLHVHVFLAGGIVAKNVEHTRNNASFYKAFCENYTDLLNEFLADIPISIITDYNVSLIGGAHAYLQLGPGRLPRHAS